MPVTDCTGLLPQESCELGSAFSPQRERLCALNHSEIRSWPMIWSLLAIFFLKKSSGSNFGTANREILSFLKKNSRRGRYTVFTPTHATIAAAAAAPSKGAFRALAAASSYIASATMRMPWRCANGWLPQAHGLAAPCTDRPTCGTRCTAVRTERRRPEGGGVAHRCCSGSRMARSPAARRAEHLCQARE